MEQKELTEEQKKKIKALYRSTMMKQSLIGLKCASLLFLSNMLVVIADALYVHSQTFAFVGGMLNAIFIFRGMSVENKKEYDRVKEEAKKILES